jgi:RNA polymerase sigma factor (sigma-70 family)
MSARTRRDPAAACATLARMVEEQPRRLPRRLRGIVRDGQLAEELAQEAVARAGRGLCRLEGGSDEALLCAWLDRIARNVAFNHLRDSSRRPSSQPLDVTPEAQLADTAGDTTASVLLADTRQELRGALDELPAQLAEVVAARLVHERSTADTARQLGISEALVKRRLFRARAQLRERLSTASVP